MSRLLVVLTAVLLAQGCASYDDPFLDAAVSTSAGQPLPPEDDEGDAPQSSILECELPLPCEAPFEGMVLAGKQGDFAASDLCALKALASGEPGLVETVAEFTDQTAYLDYAVLGPGVVLQQAWGYTDAGGQWQRDAVRCELQPAEFFARCLEAPSFECFAPELWVRECADLDILTCPG